MKLINLLESLCFSMETVHKLLLPPMEKRQEGHSTQSHATCSFQHTFPQVRLLTHRSGVWTRWPPRAGDHCVYFASLISLSRFWLIEFLQKIHIQKFFKAVINGSCTYRRGYTALRCLLESPTTNPALMVAALPSTHTGIVSLLFPFVPLTHFSLCASELCTFMECNTFYQVLSHQRLQQFFKGDIHMPVV